MLCVRVLVGVVRVGVYMYISKYVHMCSLSCMCLVSAFTLVAYVGRRKGRT